MRGEGAGRDDARRVYGIVSLWRWWAARGGPAAPWRRRAVVLLYHRVAVPEVDPWALAVSPSHFEEHMAVLRRRVAVVPLGALPELLERRGAARRCVAVTFDDGYADNLFAAAPILARHDVPATVFVAAGALGGREFWWDRLARLLLLPGVLPDRLALHVGGARLAWPLGAAAVYGGEAFATHRGWQAGTEPPTERHALFVDLWRRLQSLRAADQDATLDALAEWAGAGGSAAASARALLDDELRSLAAHPLVEIGGHTVSHPRLAALGRAEQQAEIVEGRRRLAAATGRPISAFAYPFGRPGDFTDDTARAVRDAGFRLACANQSGTVGAATDRYRLPRAYVRDCDGAAFESQLARWLRLPTR